MDLIKPEIEVFATLKSNFTQAQYETYQKYLIENATAESPSSVLERVLVQGAINAGILQGLSTPIEECPPRVVKWLVVKVRDFINSEVEVPTD